MSGFGSILAKPCERGVVRVFALGQAAFALRGAERLVLVDPWLSTQLEEEAGVTRAVPPALRPEEVEAADLVCITHEHGDHLDPRALSAIARQVPGAAFLAPEPAVELVVAAGVPAERVSGMEADATAELGGARVTAVRAAHEPDPAAFGGYRFWQDDAGRHRALGYLVELDGRRVFHAGDTVWWPGLEQAIARLEPELAILPINGRDPLREARQLWGNLDAEEAAGLAAAAGVPAVVPCHWDGVEGNLGDPDTFVRALAFRAPECAAQVLRAGESLDL